jgi:hypothetical protein
MSRRGRGPAALMGKPWRLMEPAHLCPWPPARGDFYSSAAVFVPPNSSHLHLSPHAASAAVCPPLAPPYSSRLHLRPRAANAAPSPLPKQRWRCQNGRGWWPSWRTAPPRPTPPPFTAAVSREAVAAPPNPASASVHGCLLQRRGGDTCLGGGSGRTARMTRRRRARTSTARAAGAHEHD